MRSLPKIFGLTYGDEKKTLGDLVVTSRVLYYFPHSNLEAKSSAAETTVGAGLLVAAHVVVPGLGQVAHFAPEIAKWAAVLRRRSVLKRKRLVCEGDSSSMLQDRLDAEIGRLKLEGTSMSRESSLPMPLRITPEQVLALRLTWRAELRIQTAYIEHRFLLGLGRKTELALALTEAGFIKLHSL